VRDVGATSRPCTRRRAGAGALAPEERVSAVTPPPVGLGQAAPADGIQGVEGDRQTVPHDRAGNSYCRWSTTCLSDWGLV
jgi:hypothetical protein